MPANTAETGTAAKPGLAVERGSARARLLAAANELFYEEGVHTVGIDRVIERAGVAKASLYNTFGSKDELIKAYLEGRHVARQKRVADKIAGYDNPRDRLLGVFDALGDLFREPTFRGCAFANASAEAAAGSSVEEVSDKYRGWVHTLFVGLARDAGAADPDALAGQLVLLYDGAVNGAKMDRNPEAAATARAVAAALLDAATAH